MAGKVNWFEQRVMLEVNEATERELLKIAHQVEGQAKVNITDNDQIDTGFMRASGYVVSSKLSTYNEGYAKAYSKDLKRKSRRRGKSVNVFERAMGPELPKPNKLQAAVVFGAEYTIYQEMRMSFLYDALVQVAGNIGGSVRATP